jgi:enoyl-CoA hydratase/carnithine racemase
MIRIDDDHALRTVTLDRPEKRNALSPEMLGALADAFAVPETTRAVAVLGEGKSFCAGFDLRSERPTPDHALLRAQLSALSDAIVAMRACPAPVVLGAHGAAVAGGCALLGGADVVVADAQAKLGYPVVRLGLSPAVSCPFLIGAVGGRSRAMTLDASLVTGARAHELGLVHELVDTPGEVAARTIAVARTLADKPGDGARATKLWLAEVEGLEPGAVTAGLDASLGSLSADTVARIEREVFGS